MDSTRYKRRETQTRRPTTTNFRGGHTPVARTVSSMDAAVTVRPLQSRVADIDTAPLMATNALAPTSVTIEPLPVYQGSAIPAAPALPPKRQQPISMDVPGDPSPEKIASVRVLKSKWKAARRWAFRSTAIVLILVIASGGLIISQGWLKARKVFNGGTTTAAALSDVVDPQLLKGEGDGRINVLLLGRGGGSHDAPDLTDTIILASIDPVNHTATLLSVPRDLWVNVEGAGKMKINATWSAGKYKHLGKVTSDNSNSEATLAGFNLLNQTVEGVVGVPIHYNILIDFEAFKQAIDTVGGISLNVPEKLVDPTIAWENGRNPVIAEAGTQTFDGQRALLYSRSRATSNDFARSQRQRAVLLALKDQVQTLGTLTNPTKLASLGNAFGNNVQTDLNMNDAARFAGIVKEIKNSTVNSIGLADAPNSFLVTAAINDQSVVQPKAGLFDYTAIQTFVRSQLKDPYIIKEQAKLEIYNGTTIEGLASTQAEILKSYGYTVTGTANAPTKGYNQTIIVDLSKGKSKFTKQYLEQRYGVTAITKLPDAAILPNGADFVIIVGNDTTTLN